MAGVLLLLGFLKSLSAPAILLPTLPLLMVFGTRLLCGLGPFSTQTKNIFQLEFKPGYHTKEMQTAGGRTPDCLLSGQASPTTPICDSAAWTSADGCWRPPAARQVHMLLQLLPTQCWGWDRACRLCGVKIKQQKREKPLDKRACFRQSCSTAECESVRGTPAAFIFSGIL